MIREIVRPKETHLKIQIPQEYIGQEIEYIVFPVNASNEIIEEKRDIRTLGGSLNQYANPDGITEEAHAWEHHVLDKFSK